MVVADPLAARLRRARQPGARRGDDPPPLRRRVRAPADRLLGLPPGRRQARRRPGRRPLPRHRPPARRRSSSSRGAEHRQRASTTWRPTWPTRPPTPHLADGVRALRAVSQLARDVIELRSNPASSTQHEIDRIEAELAQALTGAVAVEDVARSAFEQLVELGRDPAGPHGALLAPENDWWKAWTWPAGHAAARAARPGRRPTTAAEAREQVLTEMLGVIYSGAGRDIESLGFGYLAPIVDACSSPPVPGADAGAVRADRPRRHPQDGRAALLPGRARQAAARPTRCPQALRRWLEAVCANNPQLDRGRRAALGRRQPAAPRPAAGRLAAEPGPDWSSRSSTATAGAAQRCNWTHLHGDAGTCQHCLQPSAGARTVPAADAARQLLRRAGRRRPAADAA